MNLELGHHAAPADLVAIAELSNDIVCFLSDDARVHYVNAAGRALLGLSSPSSTSPTSLEEYVWPDDLSVAKDAMARASRTQGGAEITIRLTHQQTGDSRAVSGHVVPLKTPDAAGAFGYTLVVRPAADDLSGAPLTDLAARSRVMELLTAVVGHDLRNPLNAILTCAHFVLQQSETPGARNAMNRIISSGHRMQRMIDQLLDLTRLRTGGGIPLRPSTLDMHAIIEQTIQEIRLANPGWSIDLQRTGDTSGLWDEDRVTQMMSNLLGNAVQHGTRESGIHVDIDGTDAERVTVAIRNGGTIPEDLAAILFNPFRVVHHKREKSTGLGLGLYVTRQIALAHGGDVEAKSDAHESTFVVRLPRHASAGTASRSQGDSIAEEMAALDRVAPVQGTSVTASLFGAVPLHERSPREYWEVFEQYARLLDVALDHQTYRGEEANLSDELRTVAARLGALGAGPREVAELHGRALRQKTRGVAAPKAHAFTAEGRLVSFELMGHLVAFYRRRSGLGSSGPSDV